MSRIITPIHLLPALIAAASHGGEVTVDKRPFWVEKTFKASVIPQQGLQLISLNPEKWDTFTIVNIAPHGARVTKGATLLAFDVEPIDQRLEDIRKNLASQALALAQAEHELNILQKNAADRLATVRRAASIAKEENEYFDKVRRKAAEGTATQNLKRSQQILANQREELKQLTKMYEADDVTEETEEIILIRQRDSVSAAEFALSMEVLEHKRTLEITLPREAAALAENERATALAVVKAEQEIPAEIERKKLDLEALKITQSRTKQQLAELEKDRTLFEIKASGPGTFYHGPIEGGTWTTGDLIKSLQIQKNAPLHQAIASFVPEGTQLDLVALVDEETQRALQPGLSASVLLPGQETHEIPAKLTRIAAFPDTQLFYQADLTVTWPEELSPAIGSSAEVRLIAYEQSSTIAIPTRALKFRAIGWSVEVKLADGKTEHRPVRRGLSSKDETEILSGLDVGQVVVVP